VEQRILSDDFSQTFLEIKEGKGKKLPSKASGEGLDRVLSRT
jgi:hypothetical protein